MKFSDKLFYGRKAFKMRALAVDDSLMREKLALELYKSANVPVQEGAFARLFINGDTYGLYMISDSFNKKWLSAYVHGNEKTSVGFSYKMDSSPPDGPYADFKYLGDSYENYMNLPTYNLDIYDENTIKSDDLKTQWTPLANFIIKYNNWIKKYKKDTSDKAITELKKFLDVETTLRILAIETLILPLDNFWLISGNTALYYNTEKGHYQFIPYDFDQVMHGSWEIEQFNPKNYMKDCITWANYNEKYYEHYFINNLFVHPQITQRYNEILAAILNKSYKIDVITNYLQVLHDLIQDDVQWNIDAVSKLSIPYNGEVENFTMEDFEMNMSKEHEYTSISTSYRLWEFVDVRSSYCKAYVNSLNKTTTTKAKTTRTTTKAKTTRTTTKAKTTKKTKAKTTKTKTQTKTKKQRN